MSRGRLGHHDEGPGRTVPARRTARPIRKDYNTRATIVRELRTAVYGGEKGPRMPRIPGVL